MIANYNNEHHAITVNNEFTILCNEAEWKWVNFEMKVGSMFLVWNWIISKRKELI